MGKPDKKRSHEESKDKSTPRSPSKKRSKTFKGLTVSKEIVMEEAESDSGEELEEESGNEMDVEVTLTLSEAKRH